MLRAASLFTMLFCTSLAAQAPPASVDCHPSGANPARADSLFELRYQRWEGGDIQSAASFVADFRAVIAAAPPSYSQWLLMGILLSTVALEDSGPVLAREAIALWPRCPTARAALPRMLRQAHQDEAAREAARQVAIDSPQSPFALAQAADLLLRLGDSTSAVQLFESAVALDSRVISRYPVFAYTYGVARQLQPRLPFPPPLDSE